MKRKRHSEEQIIGILKQHEAGVEVKDLIRQAGISEKGIVLVTGSLYLAGEFLAAEGLD